MSPQEYCQQKAAASGSSFYYSFLFLPAERRRAITALYAFCREVDDVVDEGLDPQLAAIKLAWWRTEVGNMFAGNPQHPVTKALGVLKDEFSITADRLNEIIDGMEMDLNQTRYLDWAGLERYCYRVAGVVGLLAAGIFGYRDARTLDYARHLGIAFQLTNIIRDVGEDARKNRIYLPAEDLQRFKVPAADLLQARESAEFHQLMAFQAERARSHYRQAAAALPAGDRRAQRPGLIMAAIYR
ncbi:MAG TPA: presqualene diphosphate synthase HpnD, partial [Burkholderiales bacterium]|nr:presqualene diphosphate synthase HpnD [Burkholderiales bacterium]